MTTAILKRRTKTRAALSRRVPAPMPRYDKQYTADELLHFPSDWHYELIEGYLRLLMMPTGDLHCSCTMLFGSFVTVYIVSKGLGFVFSSECGFQLADNPDTVKSPDFAFVAKARMPPFTGKYAKVAPDLVLETRSPSDRKAGIEEKIAEWLSFGVLYVLDLNPAKETLAIHRPGHEPVTLTKTDTFTAEDILPGFALPLTKVFIEP